MREDDNAYALHSKRTQLLLRRFILCNHSKMCAQEKHKYPMDKVSSHCHFEDDLSYIIHQKENNLILPAPYRPICSIKRYWPSLLKFGSHYLEQDCTHVAVCSTGAGGDSGTTQKVYFLCVLVLRRCTQSKYKEQCRKSYARTEYQLVVSLQGSLISTTSALQKPLSVENCRTRR